MGSDKSDKLVIRIISIITMLNNGQSLSVKELAEEFSVSERTILTDLNERLSKFLPIEKKNKRYCLESFVVGQLGFSDIRNFASLSGIQKLYPTLDDSLLADVLNAKINDACLVKGENYEDLQAKTKEFDLLRLAIIMKHILEFSYNDKLRTVKPYKMVNTNGIWYLAGDDGSKLKTFTFSKIKNLKNTEKKFKPEREFLEIINANRAKWFSQESISVILQIDTKVAEYFLRRELLPEQTVLKHTNKFLTLKVKVSYEEEILKVVRYWIPHIKIIEPEYLQEKLLEELNLYINS